MSIQLSSLTATQLRRAADIKEKIEALNEEIALILGAPGPVSANAPKRRKMSRAGRARIAAAQKARWAKVKGAKPAKAPAKKRKMSAAAKAKISAAAKARWAKVKAAGKKTL
jgi:phosphoribosyl-dephospho-CoA transferase